MRSYILFLSVIAPFISFSQSKKDLISEAQYQAMRKEITMDSLKNLISSKKTALSALKQSNDKLSKQTDSLQILLSGKKEEVNLLRKNNEQTDVAYNSEIKKVEGYGTTTNKMNTYLKLAFNSFVFFPTENKTNDFYNAINYLENEAELLLPNAKEENEAIAKKCFYDYYDQTDTYKSENSLKALQYADTDAQKAKCLGEICTNLGLKIYEMNEANAWENDISKKRLEHLGYALQLEEKFPTSKEFLDVYLLSTVSDTYRGQKDLDKALKYMNLLLKKCSEKDIQYYHYTNRRDIYADLGEYELALKDSELGIAAYKQEKRDLTTLYFQVLSKIDILIALDRFNEANNLCDKLISELSSKEQSRKFMSNKKSWILSKKVVCLYELGKISQADAIFDFLSEYYICDDLIFSCGEQVFEPCIYHETYY